MTFHPIDFMANLLAVTLGCPKDSTHMYERIFEIGALNGAKCPGSGKLLLSSSLAHSLTYSFVRSFVRSIIHF